MKKINNYWLFQAAGWLGLVVLNVVVMITFSKFKAEFVRSIIVTAIIGLLLTHLMRYFLLRFRISEKQINQQIPYFLILTSIFAILFGVTAELVDKFILGYTPEKLQEYSLIERLIFSSLNSFWLILIWNFIYFFYHVFQTNRKQQIDTLRLETAMKNLELKTIKSHINPHFIFNSLNSIRALVDESPGEARTAITQLSNILRSSLDAQNRETVPLYQEMEIVEDYLSLEQMRFDERLQVKMDIDSRSKSLPIPPMMVQTLVENAIKHGISKRMEGGVVEIKSGVEDNFHLITVTNSGQLGQLNGEQRGFGIKSTKDRLNLLYKGGADFEIIQTDDDKVVSKIKIPIQS